MVRKAAQKVRARILASETRERDNLIGTSGWSYASWRGPFFPEFCRRVCTYSFKAGQFGSTELNGVFYRTDRSSCSRLARSNS